MAFSLLHVRPCTRMYRSYYLHISYPIYMRSFQPFLFQPPSLTSVSQEILHANPLVQHYLVWALATERRGNCSTILPHVHYLQIGCRLNFLWERTTFPTLNSSYCYWRSSLSSPTTLKPPPKRVTLSNLLTLYLTELYSRRHFLS